MGRLILCVDFDGVIHAYKSGWKGADVIEDPPVPGAIQWIQHMIDEGYEVAIYSARSKEEGGIQAIKDWLLHWAYTKFNVEQEFLTFPTQKPKAYITIDDRAWCFTGTFPSVEELKAFTPWNKRKFGLNLS